MYESEVKFQILGHGVVKALTGPAILVSQTLSTTVTRWHHDLSLQT